MTNRVRLLRSLTAGGQPGSGSAADYGRLAVNLTDRRIWMYGATGTPALVASFVGDHQTTRAYRVGDLVVQGQALYRCIVNHNPKGFTPTDWESVADDKNVLLYRTPTLQTQATLTMGAADVSARVVAHSAQSEPLHQWQVGSTVVSDIRSDGYPGGAFGRAVFRVDQVAHSFSAVGQPTRFDGSNWVLAEANTPAGFATGVIRRIIDANAVEVQVGGRIDGMEAGAFESGSYAANTLYYVSVATPGKLTSVPPPDAAEQNTVLRTLSGGSAVIQFQLPATGSGGTSYDLNVTQNPNPFTAVGQVAAYDGSAWVLADPATATKVPVAVVKATSGFDILLGFVGEITDIAPGAAASFPLTPGAAYYSTAAGLLTATPPESSALGAGPVLWATGGDKGIILTGQASPDTLRASANLSDLTDVIAAQGALGVLNVVRMSRRVATGTGLTGGGDLFVDRTLALNSASIASLAKADTAVQPARLVNSGTGLTGGGDLSGDRTLALTGQALALHNFGGTGMLVRTGASAFTSRQIAAGDGVAVTNGSGVAGNPAVAVDATVVRTSRLVNTGTGLTGGGALGADRTLSLTGQALAFHNLAASGMVARTAADTVAARTITAGTGIAVTNGSGVSGNPTLALTGQALQLHNLNTVGFVARATDGTIRTRALAGDGNSILVTNGDGNASFPVVSAILASQAEAEAGTNTVKLMTPQRTKQAMNATGSAPMYACRAWVNFNGTLAAASMIRASGNVTSITDNGTGDYTINFTTAMPDAGYAVSIDIGGDGNTQSAQIISQTTSGVRIGLSRSGTGPVDQPTVCVMIFR